MHAEYGEVSDPMDRSTTLHQHSRISLHLDELYLHRHTCHRGHAQIEGNVRSLLDQAVTCYVESQSVVNWRPHSRLK